MSKLFLWLIVLSTLIASGCSSSNSVSTKDIPDSKSDLISRAIAITPLRESDWTQRIPELKPSIRSCLMANRNIAVVVGVSQTKSKGTVHFVDAGKKQFECSTDLSTGKADKAIALDKPKLVSATAYFYPVGKKMIYRCVQPTRIKDLEGRMMGSLCR